jgi:hypothetical protein
MDHSKQKLRLAAGCLLCAVVVWIRGGDLEGTELGGGRVTGPLLQLNDAGGSLFILGLLLTFVFRRIAAVTILLACLLCLPLCVYFAAPGPFRWVFRGEYKVHPSSSFVWDWWSIVAIVAFALAASAAVAVLRGGRIRRLL